VRDKASTSQSRTTSIHWLLEGLVRLVRMTQANESSEDAKETRTSEKTKKIVDTLAISSTVQTDERASRRTKIPPDIWQDTLSLLCDNDCQVRQDAAAALIYYISQEMPRNGENNGHEGPKHIRRLPDGSSLTIRAYQSIGDGGLKFLNSIHAYAFILAISPSLNVPLATVPTSTTENPSARSSADSHDLQERPATTPTTGRRSLNTQNSPRVRKESLILRLLEKMPPHPTASSKATEEDYVNILKILNTIHIYLPLYGLMTQIPMLLALNNALDTQVVTSDLMQRIVTIKTVITHVWRTIGQVWKLQELVSLADEVSTTLYICSNNLSLILNSQGHSVFGLSCKSRVDWPYSFPTDTRCKCRQCTLPSYKLSDCSRNNRL